MTLHKRNVIFVILIITEDNYASALILLTSGMAIKIG